MTLKRLFSALALVPFITLSSIHANAEIEYVVLKQPNYTETLRIAIDTEKQTIAMESCDINSGCKKIGRTTPISDLQKVQDQKSSNGNLVAGGATIAAVVFMGAILLCMTKSKCAAVADEISFLGVKGTNGWPIWANIGAAVAGGAVGYSLTDDSLAKAHPVLEIKNAIEQALNRDDQETGALEVETTASFKEIKESFSALQLLLKNN